MKCCFSHQHGNHMPDCIWVHCESLTAQSNSVQPSDSTTYLDASIPLISSQGRIADFASWHSAHKTNTCFPFENIARYQINYYWFSELDKQLILWVKKRAAFLHVLIWMTWQQSRQNRHWGTTAVVLGERSNWRRRIQRRHLQPKACHSHVAEAEVRVDAPPWARSGSVIMRWGRSNCQCRGEYTVLLLTWPWVPLLWLFIGPWLRLCAEETPAESWLPADRPDSWTHGWMAAHPIKPTGAHTCSRKVWELCVCMWLCIYHLSVRVTGHICDVCAQRRVCLCALTSHRLMRTKSKQPGEAWINRRRWQTDSSTAADSTGRTAGQSMPLFSIHICV